jgi:ABC-type Fe3+/spermidine/putrescine transport system ATPase subunit
MREEIHRLHGETGLTMVYVTHDQKEALALADRLGVMDRGRLVQVGAPAEVYNRPANRFVAGFLGDTNFLPGTVRHISAGECTVDTAPATLVGVPVDSMPAKGSRVVCCIRPHALAIDTSGTGPNRIPAQVEEVSFLGELVQVRLVAVGQTHLQMAALPNGVNRLKPGGAVTLTVAPGQVVVLAEESGEPNAPRTG